MTFRMIVQLWNTNTPAIVSRDADLTENYMYISMKFGMEFVYFAGKLVFLILLASVQLAVSHISISSRQLCKLASCLEQF